MRSFSLHNKGVFYGIVLILLVILIVLTKIAFTPTNNLPTNPVFSTPKAIDPCTRFSKDIGKISCEKAKEIALKKLPGLVTKIDKENKDIVDSNGLSNIYKLWIVTIKTDKPIKNNNEFIIGISTVNGEVKYSTLE